MMTMFTMGMLGDFDRDVFESDFAVLLFVVFMTLVVIVLLNVSSDEMRLTRNSIFSRGL